MSTSFIMGDGGQLQMQDGSTVGQTVDSRAQVRGDIPRSPVDGY